MNTINFLEVSEDALKTVLTTYGRTEESLLEDITKIKEWMKTQPHLPEILEEKVIQNFLILNKCSVEKTKQRVDAYYTIRSLIPDIYENSNPIKSPNMIELTKIIYCTVLPKSTQEMYRIIVSKIHNTEMIDNLDPFNVSRYLLNVQEMRLKEDVMYGDLFILDMEGVTLSYLLKFTPSFFTKTFAIYEKVFSIPLKGIYLINSPSFGMTVLTILKSVLKPKLFERIHVCQDTSILKEHFPKELLPTEYGGEEQSLGELQERLKLKFKGYQARFDQLDVLKINENLRPKKLENDDFLGFHGNFKKLNVD